MKNQNEDNASELDLFARELPQGGLSLEALPSEYSYVRPATASSVSSFSSATSCVSSIGSASTLSS